MHTSLGIIIIFSQTLFTYRKATTIQEKYPSGVCVKEFPSVMKEQRKVYIPKCTGNDFQSFAEMSDVFIDKSGVIETLLSDAFLKRLVTFHIHRKSGKTTTLSMLRTFLQPELYNDNGTTKIKDSQQTWAYRFFKKGIIIEGKNQLLHPPAISKNDHLINNYLGKYPVIYLNFGDLNLEGKSFHQSLQQFKRTVFLAYLDHFVAIKQLLANTSDPMRSRWRHNFIYFTDNSSSVIIEAEIITSIVSLCQMLHKYYGTHPMILIDAYEHPLVTACKQPYNDDELEQISLFFESFFHTTLGLKSNADATSSFLFGTFDLEWGFDSRSMKHAICLNDMIETGLKNQFYQHFGVTKTELAQLLKVVDLHEKMPQVEDWYEGYSFQECDSKLLNIYSIIQFVNHREIGFYWDHEQKEFFALMKFSWFRNELFVGQLLGLSNVPKSVPEDIRFYQHDVETMNDLLQWQNLHAPLISKEKLLILKYLLTTGYLTYVSSNRSEKFVQIPNKEISSSFHNQSMQYDRKIRGIETYSMNHNISDKYRNWLINNDEDSKREFEASVQNLINAYNSHLTDETKIQKNEQLLQIIMISALKCLEYSYHRDMYRVVAASRKKNEPDIIIYNGNYLSLINLQYGVPLPTTSIEIEQLFFGSKQTQKAEDATLSPAEITAMNQKRYNLYFCSIKELKTEMYTKITEIRTIGMTVLRSGKCQFFYKTYSFNSSWCQYEQETASSKNKNSP